MRGSVRRQQAGRRADRQAPKRLTQQGCGETTACSSDQKGWPGLTWQLEALTTALEG